MVGGVLARLRLYVSTWVSVGRPSPLGRALAHRIRVVDGCVIWVWWVPHRYLGWYVGPGLSLWCFRLWFWFQECISRNDKVASDTSSVHRLLRDLRQWSVTPWWRSRFFVSPWVSVGLPSCLDRALTHHSRGCLVCWPHLYLEVFLVCFVVQPSVP